MHIQKRIKTKEKGRARLPSNSKRRRETTSENFDPSLGKFRIKLAVPSPSSSTSDLTFLSYFGLVPWFCEFESGFVTNSISKLFDGAVLLIM